ncbi:WXG100-like domain-containing protein [Kitasatospora sp. P5_F3]
MKKELPPELADVLKTLHSSEQGGDVQFPDGNEERINDLAAAWKTFNEVADVRIRTIWAHAQRACEHMSGEAAQSYERYLEKYGVGEGSHAGTILTAGKMVEAHLTGAAAAITDTKTTMINQLEYAKKYIEQNPAGKKDDIAKSAGVKSAVEAYHTYVKDVTGSVDTMLKAGADHGAATEAATQIANLAGGKVPPPGGDTPPPTKIDSAPPGGGAGGGGAGAGAGGGGAGSGAGGGGAGGGAGGGGGAPKPKPYTPPKVQPYKPPATKNPYLGGNGLGPDGKPLFKTAVQPPGLNLAGHPGYQGLGDGSITPYSGSGGGGAGAGGGGVGGGAGGGSAFGGGGVPGAGAYGRGGGLAGAGGAGARGAGGAAGGGRGGMAGGAAGAASGRGTAGAPGAGAMGGGAGGGKGGGAGGGNRFLRPTRLGSEEEKEKRRRDRGVVGGEQVDHEAGDPHFERMRRQWLDEARGGSSGEAAAAAAAAAAAQPAVGGSGDLMTQLAGALLGAEPTVAEAGAEAGGAVTSADSPVASTGGTVAPEGTTTAPPAAPAPEEEYLDRARSVAERRGRPDEEGQVTEAPAAVVEPTPIRQEGGYDVPSPFLRAALTRIAAGAGAEGGGTPRP